MAAQTFQKIVIWVFKRSQSDALQEEAFLHDDDDVPHLLKKARLSNIKPG